MRPTHFAFGKLCVCQISHTLRYSSSPILPVAVNESAGAWSRSSTSSPEVESTARDCCCVCRVCLLTDNAEISVGSVGGTL